MRPTAPGALIHTHIHLKSIKTLVNPIKIHRVSIEPPPRSITYLRMSPKANFKQAAL